MATCCSLRVSQSVCQLLIVVDKLSSYSGISHRIITGKLFARDVKARLEMTTADDVVKLQNAVNTGETDRTGALVAVRVVECRICNREVAGSNLGRSDFAPRSILGLPSRRGR